MDNYFEWLGLTFNLISGGLGIIFILKSDFIFWCEKHIKIKKVIHLLHISILMMALGVLFQAHKFGVIIITGTEPVYEMPYFILKDLGINLFVFTLVLWMFLHHKNEIKP